MNVRLLVGVITLLLSAIHIALPISVFAVSESAIELTATPQSPTPGENVTIIASSYASNLNTVNITWFVNGKKISGGIGQKSVSFTASVGGADTTVKATISLPSGATDRQITIRPSTMVLLYEAVDAYVPPFYRGKALPSIGSDIKIVALPEIKSGAGFLSPKNMVYEWTRNYTNDAGAGGYGKNSFIYTNDYLEDSEVIGVTASTTDGQYSLQGSTSVAPNEPHISFYEYDKDKGTLWEKALQDGHVITGNEVILAEPYFITPKQIQTPRLVFSWSINDNAINAIGRYRQNMFPVRAESEVSGTSKLKLEIENKDDFLETVQKEISLQF